MSEEKGIEGLDSGFRVKGLDAGFRV